MRRTILALLACTGLAAAGWADHPDPRQMDDVKAAAHRLEQAVRHVQDSAGRGDRDRLGMLERRARHFHKQVDRYQDDPIHTERDFEDLADAYYRVVDELHYMSRHVRDDFRDVQIHMRTLMDYYDRGDRRR